eukprot:1779167-Alexandrium_andersonii.AAC.1
MAQKWHCNTQYIEGINSVVKSLCVHCPWLGWGSMSARVKAKMKLNSLDDDPRDKSVRSKCVEASVDNC